MAQKSLNRVDDAIVEYVKENSDGKLLVTNWVFIASVTNIGSDHDGYVTQSSPNMPHHAQVGLLNMALDDKRNLGLLATLRAAIEGDDG